jgi:hypothetical protein
MVQPLNRPQSLYMGVKMMEREMPCLVWEFLGHDLLGPVPTVPPPPPLLTVMQRWAHALFFYSTSATATPQLEGRISAAAYRQLFKEMLLCNSPHISNRNFSAVRNLESAPFYRNVSLQLHIRYSAWLSAVSNFMSATYKKFCAATT